MQFRTEVKIPPAGVQLVPSSHVLFLGSCFAEHVGQRMAESLPEGNIRTNPCGVLYNPASIAKTLSAVISPYFEADEKHFFYTDEGLWHHWGYSTRFTAERRETLTEGLRAAWEEAHRLYEQMDVLFVTFSTDHAYILKESGAENFVVANCHKQPASLFIEQVLDSHAVLTAWSELLKKIHREHPAAHVVFTLSPYRYAKYGMHASQLSKARLLLLIDELCAAHEWASYFPAYEIVQDELRDYRFYQPDMLHPSEQAVDYVWDRFKAWAFSAELSTYAAERQALLRDLAHRPLHPESESYRVFAAKLEEKRKRFQQKWGESL